jgi:hypothetical protein
MKLTKLLENIVVEIEGDKQVDALTAAMGQGFNLMGSELKNKEGELKQDVEQANIELDESLTALTVIGMLLAAPKVVELIVKGFSGTVKLYKKMFMKGGAKTEEEQEQMAAKIIEFTHKWHKQYIKALKWIFKVTGLYKKAGINDEAAQMKVAELVYYTIVAGLAVYSGVGAIGAFKQAIAHGVEASHVSLGALETAMASIKTGEVASFMTELGLKS